MNNCKYFTKGFNKNKCNYEKKGKEISYKDCINCKYKDYETKKQKPLQAKTKLKANKPIKKVSKHRACVTKQTYEYVYTRDAKKCIICASNELVELHHINGRGKDKTNDVNNCVMLCHNCHHNVVHKSNKYWRKKLNEYIKNLFS